jgi:hypothetical protein
VPTTPVENKDTRRAERQMKLRKTNHATWHGVTRRVCMRIGYPVIAVVLL